MSVEAGPAPIGRLVRSFDFERVLRIRSRAQSVHFVLHHLADAPSAPRKPPSRASKVELSTDPTVPFSRSVDDGAASGAGALFASAAAPGVRGLWLGAVVPKRHARRAVTRSLLKRQIRAAVLAHAKSMAGGLWVVRLRAGFDRSAYPSAASAALQQVARDELDRLLARCAEPPLPV